MGCLHQACRPSGCNFLSCLPPQTYIRPAIIIATATDDMADARTYSTSSRKKSVAQEPVTSVLGGDQLPIYTRELTADEEVLAALGYKPEFKREFSLWTSFCVSFAVLGLLPSFASTLYYVSRGSIPHTERPQSYKRMSGHGIRRHSRHGMGLVDCHVLHPVCRDEYG